MMAGLFQVALGLFKLGEYIRLVPYPVISGFMSGIGGIIIILQISPMLGHSAPAGTVDALFYTPTAILDINFVALFIGALTLGIAFKWPSKLAKFVPGPLAALYHWHYPQPFHRWRAHPRRYSFRLTANTLARVLSHFISYYR